MTWNSLCESCAHGRELVSGKGSRFLMCLRHRTDETYARYPPQPIVECRGFEAHADPPRPADDGQ